MWDGRAMATCAADEGSTDCGASTPKPTEFETWRRQKERARAAKAQAALDPDDDEESLPRWMTAARVHVCEPRRFGLCLQAVVGCSHAEPPILQQATGCSSLCILRYTCCLRRSVSSLWRRRRAMRSLRCCSPRSSCCWSSFKLLGSLSHTPTTAATSPPRRVGGAAATSIFSQTPPTKVSTCQLSVPGSSRLPRRTSPRTCRIAVRIRPQHEAFMPAACPRAAMNVCAL